MSLNQGLLQVIKCKSHLERIESMDNMFSVSHNKEFDLGNGETISSVYVRVYTTMFTSGLVAKMGANRFTTLMALASYMDEKGECYPTQIQVAEAIGVHKNTVNKYINELLEFEINGQPVVTRNKINKGQGKIFSYYKIHPLSQLAKFAGDVEPIESTKKSESLITSKGTTNCDVIRSNNNHSNNIKHTDTIKVTNSKNAIQYFQQVYREVYNVNYTVSNYGREGKIMKDKLITPYPDMAKEIIDIAIKQYDDLFKNARYPRPSIAMFSWAVNQIIPIVEEERKASEIASQSVELEEQAEQQMISKLSKLK